MLGEGTKGDRFDAEFLAMLAQELQGARFVSGSREVRIASPAGRAVVRVLSLGRRRTLCVDLSRRLSCVMVIGGPGPEWSLATERLADSTPPVYHEGGTEGAVKLRAWLDGAAAQWLERLALGPDERVSVFEDGITADLKRQAPPAVYADRVRTVIELALTLEEAPEGDPVRLPPAFEDLESAYRSWVVADDLLRVERLSEAPVSELRALIAAVGPRFDEINRILDDQAEPLTAEHRALQALAEVAAEAEVVLAEQPLE